MAFRDVATVNYQGTVLAFARSPDGPARSAPTDDGASGADGGASLATDIYYDVLALDVDSAGDAMDWKGFVKLALPDEVRPAGMSIVNVPVEYDSLGTIDGLTDAGVPFRVATNQDYVYLFRQAKKGTLLVNRLRLVRDTSSGNPADIRYRLDPAWEVRFQRSGKPDTPLDDKDAQSYESPDGEPFIEPAFELFMVDGLTDGNFDVAFLPRSDSDLLTCAVFVVNHEANRVDVWELDLDANGLFALGGKEFVGGRIPPDLSFQVADEQGKTALALPGRPSTAFYLKQERVLRQGGDSFLVKRNGRLLLALEAGSPPTLVSVDLAVAGDGTLAQPAPLLACAPVGVANYALRFDEAAYVGLPDWSPSGAFAVDVWLYPEAFDVPAQQILGNLSDTTAPYLRLVSGTALEVGFTSADGKTLSARTAEGVVRQQAWSRIQVGFDPAAASAERFTVRVNESAVPVVLSGDGTVPGGGPVNALSASANGYEGIVDALALYNAATWDPAQEVGSWPLDTVDYVDGQGRPIDPPTTPNVKVPASPGRVFGAHLVPSTSPAGNPAAALSWDARGLSIYSSYFPDLADYGELTSSPFLLAGADGLIHCYFKGRDDAFCVMQLDTETARAAFESTWHTAAGTPETGRIQFVSAQPGSFMNAATVTVGQAASAPATFCDVTFVSPSGRTETWAGVPRSLDPFAAVLQGASIADSSDPRLVGGRRTYYDPTGTVPAAYVPVTDNPAAAAVALVSRQQGSMPLASIEIVPSGGTATVTVRYTARRWADLACTDVWPDVPVNVNAFLETLTGVSPTYPYRGSAYSNVASYSLAARSQLPAPSRIVLFTHPTVDSVEEIAVSDASDPTLCTVEISLTLGGTPKTAEWREVPRDQVAFALTLEGVNSEYDYAAHATGAWKKIGDALIVTTDGSSALVDNASRDPLEPDNDLRVSSSLFAAFATAAVGAAEVVPATGGAAAAAAFQKASATDGGETTPIVGGSSIFGPLPATVPAQGSVGLVDDTASLPGGKAILTLQGFNGGWLNQPENRTLTFAWDNWVAIPTSEAGSPNIGQLTIQGDLSVELWCHPTKSRQDPMSPDQRLLTFSRTPSASEGGDPVRYLVGLQDTPSLDCATDTTIRQGFLSVDGTFYACFSAKSGSQPPSGTIGCLATLGVITPVFSVKVATDQTLSVEFSLDTTQPAITAKAKVAADEWHQVAVPYKTTAIKRSGKIDYSFDVSLYVDGQLQGSHTYTIQRSGTQPIDMAEFVLGDISQGSPKTLPMLLNEVAFFERALSHDEVEQFNEQRIPDNAGGLVLKWMLLEGDGNRANNSAATGSTYDANISPTAAWEGWGLYLRPTFAHGDIAAVLTADPIVHGWNHLAFVHQAGYALLLRGSDYGDCGNDRSLDLGDTLALEAWVQPEVSPLRAPQAVIAKGDDYELSLDPDRKPVFRVKVAIGESTSVREIKGTDSLPAGKPAYLAAVFGTVTVQPSTGQGDQQPTYEVHMDLYVNGRRAAWGIQDPAKPGSYKEFSSAPKRISSRADVNLGRTTLRGGSSYLRGYLADVRLWSRALDPGEIASVYGSRHAPARRDGLVSYWRFAEVDGKIAFDSAGANNAKLNRGDLRLLYQPTSANWFYVNGTQSAAVDYVDGPLNVGGYGTGDQFLMAQVSAGFATGFYGQLDEVRVWGTMLTGEQIADTMTQPLTGGERGLRGYWNFDNGSGVVVSDRTGRGNNGTLASSSGTALPAWGTSEAPINNEAPVVFDILGGIPTFEQIDISETPSVVEYADLERDAYGTLFSVMKRAYVAVRDGTVDLVTGFKVGDLDTVYLGQAQSSPSLIGFIEGAPPIPSENQTLPYWLGDYSSLNTYARASSVGLTEAENVVYTVSADRDSGTTDAFTVKGGLYFGGQYAASAGIGFEVETPTVVFEGHLGLQGGFELGSHSTGGVNVQNGSTTNIATGLSPQGAWEAGTDPSGWVNATVGRRYVPDNNGLALVKSLTVDLYASILRSTGAMVKMTAVPNPDIPVDVNLIDFPIDPTYVKNGTLDGMVGLKPDPGVHSRSYFRPLEAYSLKRQIERDAAQLEAYYNQFDAGNTASRLKDDGSFSDFRTSSRSTSAYDWSKHLAKRSIVNTYVWTAGGGTYAEQVQPMNVYTESYGAISSSQGSIGAVGDVQIAFPVAGFYVDLDYLHTWTTEVNAVKSKEDGASFDLASTVSPETYLYAPIIDAGGNVTFGAEPTAGKVSGYRYMSFFLAPSQENAVAFAGVVDGNWLHNSRDAAAAALREMTVAANGAWRVLHRVTYVSRVPPKFQPVPTDSQPPDVRQPPNVASNASIVELVRDEVPKDRQPTPLEIGDAIARVLGAPGSPGRLSAILPWWDEFLAQSTDYVLPAGKIVRALREDLLQYMLEWYAAFGPDGHG